MGKFNEIQEETKQSFGNNSFTTKIANDAVEFDSAADQFKFLDPIDAPAITINGETVSPTQPQVQSNWNQTDNTKADFIKNKPVDSQGNLKSNTILIGSNNTLNGGTNALLQGENNTISGTSAAAVGSSSCNVSGQYAAAVGSSNCGVQGNNTVVLACKNIQYADLSNMVYVPSVWNQSQIEILVDNQDGVTRFYNKKRISMDYSVQGGGNITIAFPMNANQALVIDLKYCIKKASGSTVSGTIRQGNTSTDIVNLTADGEWHSIIVEPDVPNTNYMIHIEDGVAGDTISYICETVANTNH